MMGHSSILRYQTFEFLTDACFIVANKQENDLAEICNWCDQYATTHGLSTRLIKSWLDQFHIYDWRKDKDQLTWIMAKALGDTGFRQRFSDFVAHYQGVPYHAVYIRNGEHPDTFDDVPFLAQFFGVLHNIASSTLDIFFREEDLLPHTVGTMNESYGGMFGSTWEGVVASSRSKTASKRICELNEDVIAVWDNRFLPQIVPMGRFEQNSRVGVIAALVWALENGRSVKSAATFAQTNLFRSIPLPAPQTQRYKQEVEGWRKELLARHVKYPDRGYDEVERTLALLLSPSLPARIYGNARLRLIAAILAGTIAATGSAETIINAPEAWSTVVHLVTSSSHSHSTTSDEKCGQTSPEPSQRSPARPPVGR
jgi:hypothetical protein